MRIALTPTWFQEFEKEADYMVTEAETKQAEIDEILSRHTQLYGRHLEVLKRELSEAGVVIKVDRELPDRCYFNDDNKDMELELSGHTQVDMLRAGYEAVEPLIKDC